MEWQETHRTLLAELWRDPGTAAAVQHAAPDLARSLAAPDGWERPRTALALDRYVNRMSTRPTPFGLLAGVAGARVGPGPALRLTAALRARVSPDASWSLPRTPGTPSTPVPDDRTTVVAAGLAHTTGGHLWLEPQGRERPVWLRSSPPVVLLLRAAVRPTRVGALRELLAARYPTADPMTGQRLVAHLLRLGFLRRDTAPAAVPAAVLDLCSRFNESADPAGLADLDAALARYLSLIHI